MDVNFDNGGIRKSRCLINNAFSKTLQRFDMDFLTLFPKRYNGFTSRLNVLLERYNALASRLNALDKPL
jgi:hypothetical protein